MSDEVKLLFGGDIQFDRIQRPLPRLRRIIRVSEETEAGNGRRTLKYLASKYFNLATRYPRIPRLLGKMTGGLFDSIHEKWIIDAYSNKLAFHLYNLLNPEEHMECRGSFTATR